MIAEDEILALADHIVRAFSPERIILFGSHAFGTPREDSDVDLLVVMPFEGRSIDQAHEMWKTLRPPFSVDFLVRRPDDVTRRYEQWDPLIREALDKGKVLYDRDRQGVAVEGTGRSGRRSA